MENWSVYLKRRRLARDYFMNVPSNKIDIDIYGFNKLTGFGLNQPCGSVGCVAGWLYTMPEFQESNEAVRSYNGNDILVRKNLSRWLGIKDEDWVAPPTFYGKKINGISAKEEGLQRLDALVAEAEAKVKQGA